MIQSTIVAADLRGIHDLALKNVFNLIEDKR